MTASPSQNRPRPTSHPPDGGFPPFDRNHYFTGKLLTARDLTLEQDYVVNRLRLHRLALHGWGIVCGLNVLPHPYCPDKYLVVQPGLAVDRCGREIYLSEAVHVELPVPPPATTGGRSGRPADALYTICLTYAEAPQEEQTPAPFDECGCPTHPYQHNRVRDGYRVTLEPGNRFPPAAPPPAGENCLATDAERRRLRLEGCPVPEDGCLPLALLRGYTPGGPVTPQNIDLRGRPVLPSVRMLDEEIQCLARQVSAGPFIESMNWQHGDPYPFHALCHYRLDNPAGAAGLELVFSEAVRGFDNFAVQVRVTLHGDGRAAYPGPPRHHGGPVEVAPTRFQTCDEHDKTKLTIILDKDYLASLSGQSFDVIVAVQGNLLWNAAGRPVAGQLRPRPAPKSFAIRPPTDLGPPGGLFESWFLVSPEGGAK